MLPILIKPQEREIIIKKEIKKLFKDHGWKGKSEFSCNICNKHFSEGINIDNGETYSKAKPLVQNHIKEEHPNFCYGCNKCKELFTVQSDFKNHVCKYDKF
jgi:hypothetical protein